MKMHVLRQLYIPVINLGGKLTNNYTSLMNLSLCSSKVVSELKSRSKAPADSFIHLNNPPRFLGPCGLENNLLTSSAAGGLSSFSGTCLKAVRQIPFLNKKQNSPSVLKAHNTTPPLQAISDHQLVDTSFKTKPHLSTLRTFLLWS